MLPIKINRRSLLVLIVILSTIASLITVWIWDKKERQCLEKEYKEMVNNKNVTR